MRLLTNVGFAAGPVLLVLAACTAQGSSTTVTGPGNTSGSPAFPGTTDATDGGSGQDGGTSTTNYDVLFGPPSSTVATPNAIDGLWAGTARGGTDMRLLLKPTSVVIAKHCSEGDTSATGIEVVSQVSASSIKTLESKSAPGSAGLTCALQVRPTEAKRCTSAADVDAQVEGTSSVDGCFFLGGTTLNFYGTFLDGAKLTKLSD
jgi:hypothetical protein